MTTRLIQDAPGARSSDRNGSASALVLPADLPSQRSEREPLFERGVELARIESALAEAHGTRGTFVVVEGPAGIGKTALLDATRAAAADSGMRVLRARGTELERDFAFGVVRQLFEPVLAEASEREQPNLLQATAGCRSRPARTPGRPGRRRSR